MAENPSSITCHGVPGSLLLRTRYPVQSFGLLTDNWLELSNSLQCFMGVTSLNFLFLYSCLILILDVKQHPSGYGQYLEYEKG